MSTSAFEVAIFDQIRSLVPQLAPFLDHPDVTEILVNANATVYTERMGQLQREDIEIRSIDLEPAVRRIARYLQKDFGPESPLLETRLPDGSRVAAACPPVCAGITLSIRRFPKRYTIHELVLGGMLSPAEVLLLESSLRARMNILISGGTSTGKTTMLNALVARIPHDTRLGVIEDVAEIHLADHLNSFRFEASADVTIRDCLRHALRQRPDRVIVGEVRGESAYDLLEAWNTGHSGSLATIHADRAETSLYRLSNLALQASVVPVSVVRQMIADSVHVLVHIDRVDGVRKVTRMLRVTEYCAVTDLFHTVVMQ